MPFVSTASSTSQPASCRFSRSPPAGRASAIPRSLAASGRQTASICFHAPHHPCNGIGQRNGAATLFGSFFGLDPAAGDAVIHPEQRIGDLPRDPGLGEDRGARLGRHECRRHGATEHPAEGGRDIVRAPVLRAAQFDDPLAGDVVAEQAGGGRPTSVVLTIGIAFEGSRKLGSTPSAIAAAATSPQLSTK